MRLLDDPGQSSTADTIGAGRTRPRARSIESEFQPLGTAWRLDRPDICELLDQSAPPEIAAMYYGSNACYLVQLSHPSAGKSLAIYKPARGEYPLWDFPQGTLYRREVATFRISSMLDWKIVPPTVVASGRFGVGSLQLFVEESAEEFIPVESLRRLVLLDLITNNADRKAEHVILSEGGCLWGIDHGLTFHVQAKLRTVLWHFAGEPLTDAELSDLRRLRKRFDSARGQQVLQLLSRAEGAALRQRITALVAQPIFPDPVHKAIPYRW